MELARHTFSAVTVGLAVGTQILLSQTCPPAPNRITARVSAAVTQNSASGLYHYAYTVANAGSGAQEIDKFSVQISSSVTNVTSPQGWTGTVTDTPAVLWSATEVAPAGPGEVDVGQIPPGLNQIKPGAALPGFSFDSASPPSDVQAFVSGFVLIPPAAIEEDAETLSDTCTDVVGDFFKVSVLALTKGPFQGVSFIAIVNPSSSSKDVNPGNGPISVAVLGSSTLPAGSLEPSTFAFGRAAAQAISSSLRDLNGDGVLDLVFTIDPQGAKIRCGDTAFPFTGKTRNGKAGQGVASINVIGCPVFADVNGDGQVDCSDIEIVKASFGKRFTDTGFDLRADVNSDGVVDIRDLAFVAQHLPVGTKCH